PGGVPNGSKPLHDGDHGVPLVCARPTGRPADGAGIRLRMVRGRLVPRMTRGEYVRGATVVHAGCTGHELRDAAGRARSEALTEGRDCSAGFARSSDARRSQPQGERQTGCAQKSRTRAFQASGCSKYGEWPAPAISSTRAPRTRAAASAMVAGE